MNVSEHITNILNYYKDNPECDPNVYEYIEVCGDLAKYLNDIDSEVLSNMIRYKFEGFSDMFFNKLITCGIGVDNEHPLYRLCSDSKNCGLEKNILPDQELLKKLGGVSFYILQQQRDVDKGIIDSFTYDNEGEFNDLVVMDKILSNSTKEESNSPREELMLFISSQFKEEYKIGNTKGKK